MHLNLVRLKPFSGPCTLKWMSKMFLRNPVDKQLMK